MIKKIFLILALLLFVACKPASYDAFAAGLEFKAPLEIYEAEDFYAESKCTPLPDKAPFSESILATIDFVKENLGEEFHKEATDNLRGGIVYNPKTSDTISAVYKPDFKKIELYQSLFEYGCIEEAASTLIHEMIHSIQHERYLQEGKQQSEYNLLNADELERLTAELEANDYQLYINRKLKLTGEAHTQKIVNLANDYRSQFNELKSK